MAVLLKRQGVILSCATLMAACASVDRPNESVETLAHEDKAAIERLFSVKPEANRKSSLKPLSFPRNAEFLSYPTDIVYANMGAKDAFQTLLGDHPVQFNLKGSNNPKVSSLLNAPTIKSHLDSVAIQANWAYKFVGGVFVVSDIETRRFKLDVTPGERKYKLLVDSLSDGTESANTLEGGDDPYDLLSESMKTIGFSSGLDDDEGVGGADKDAALQARFSIMPAAGLMIVSAPPSLVRRASDLVDWFNTGHTARATVEIALYELDFTRNTDRSLDLSLLSSAAVDSALNITSPAISNVSVGSAGFSMDLTDEADRLYGSAAIVKWLRSHGAVSKVIQTRKELVNNEVQTIEKRNNNPFIEKVSQSTQSAGATTSTAPEVIFGNEDEGHSMHVLPTINTDTGKVTLRLNYSTGLLRGRQDYSFGDGALEGENILTSKKSEVITMSLRDGEARIITSATIADRRVMRGDTPMLPVLGDSLQETESEKEYVLYVSVVIED
ncbi:hypothetical protein N9L66_00375 [Porticoccaceae bacterium]|nr:hypothetical protein [Porticoccaceae bacterium]